MLTAISVGVSMRRWTANFLLLVMLVPAFAPAALARIAAPEAMHCVRLQQPAPAPQSTMHCHHGIEQMSMPELPGASLRALDCCCSNHDCCRGMKTSERGQPCSDDFAFFSLLVEPAAAALALIRGSADAVAPESARAPPLG